jgi:hypothetical protein
VACGGAPTVELLIALCALQGIAAAAVLVCAFALLRAGEPEHRRVWVRAAVLGTAVGPALGGAVTELFDWRAIFLIQAPVVAACAIACRRAAPSGLAVRAIVVPGRVFGGRELALGLLAAALTGVLFLLVLLLISGWALSPLAAAAVVSILPAAAFAGTRVPGSDAARAIVGSAIVAAGVLPLAFVAADSIGMEIAPQILAGLGMGMALPALVGGLLPERTAGEAAHALAVRHLGITLALALLAPLASAQLNQAAVEVRERGTALILDARLPAQDKLAVARVAAADLDAIAPRAGLRDALERVGAAGDPADRLVYDRLQQRADETLLAAVDYAFAPAFLLCGALALLACSALLATIRPRLGRAALVACAGAALLIPTQAAIAQASRPAAVPIHDPCEPRRLPISAASTGCCRTARSSCSIAPPANSGRHARSSCSRSSTRPAPAPAPTSATTACGRAMSAAS